MIEGKTASERIDKILDMFGVEVINLVIERHQLSDQKRMYFSIRFIEEDPTKEKELTKEMDKLSEKIKIIDEKIEIKGIEKNDRLQILRDIKKVYADEWESGFVKEF